MIRLPVAISIPSPLRLFHLPTIHVAALVLCALASRGLLPQVAYAGGGCSVAPLQNGVVQFVTFDPATFEVSPGLSRWAAVAMRNADGSDWNLEARDQLEDYPTCAIGPLALSNQFGPDVLAMDGHSRGPGTDYVITSTGNEAGAFAYVEYEQAAGATLPNTVWAQIATGPNDLLTVREVQMFAGIPYSIRVQPSSNLGSLKLYVFAPATGTGWLAKNEAVLEAGLVPDSETRNDYTPSVGGIYAIVIVNESGAVGDFYFAVTHCPFSANILSEGVPFQFASLDYWPAFTPNAHSWAAVGVRGPYDLDVAPYPRWQDGTYPQCTDSVLASQLTGAGVRVVTGDFQTLPLRQYTAHANLEQPSTSTNGFVEWDGAGDAIAVNGAPTVVAPPSNNVFDAWHVMLSVGITYTFQIVPAVGATADYKLMLFGNPLPTHWASRLDAILETSAVHLFIPGYSGQYGVVVVNDNGGTGGYSVSITANLVGVDPRPTGSLASRIRSAAPNPSVGALRIEFELARAGNAEFRLRNVAGGTVATVPAGHRDAGIASFAWERAASNRGADARGVPPGVYFLSLVVDGVEADLTRIILLR
jgi:hypothetical protein